MGTFSTKAQRQGWINQVPGRRTQTAMTAVAEQLAADVQLANWGANPTGAQDYFVDGNVANTSGDGLSWDNPMQSLSEAITVSNVSIQATTNRWWARRNRIFALGDHELDEDLTIFPEKCDIIGVGYDVEPGPTLVGHHNIASIATGFARGTRWFNFRFQNDSANETFDLPTLSYAIEYYGCVFEPLLTGSSHAILLVDDNRGFKMIGCRILVSVAGSPAAGIFAEGIKVTGNGQHDIVIQGNFIKATEGIHIVSTAAAYNGWIDNNVIHATALTINDESDLFVVTDNRLISDASVSLVAGGGGIVCNELLASGNKLGGKDTVTNSEYPFVISISS